MSVKQKLIEKFGISEPKNAVSLDDKKLFIKSGITVIAALAGEGKTTKMLQMKKQWEDEGYSLHSLSIPNEEYQLPSP